MERTTTQTLKVLLNVACKMTDRDLSIETWSPGDGRTHYRIAENNESVHVSHYMKKNECELWLRAFIKGLESPRVAYTGNPWETSANGF